MKIAAIILPLALLLTADARSLQDKSQAAVEENNVGRRSTDAKLMAVAREQDNTKKTASGKNPENEQAYGELVIAVGDTFANYVKIISLQEATLDVLGISPTPGPEPEEPAKKKSHDVREGVADGFKKAMAYTNTIIKNQELIFHAVSMPRTP